MRITSAFISQMNADISSIKNRSAIGVFPDNMSLGAVLEKAYITPNYHLRKHNEDCLGIAPIYKNYKNKNVVFVGGGGTGKTTAFLRLYTGTEESIEAPCNEYFLYCFAPDLEMQTDLSGYKKRIRNAILSGQKIDGIVLLDGLEEAYWDDPEKAIDRIKKLYDSGNTIWVACRTNFYEKIYEETNLFFAERIEIENWIPEDFEEFVNRCLSNNQKKTEILQKIHRVKTNLASLIARPLFATMMLFCCPKQ